MRNNYSNIVRPLSAGALILLTLCACGGGGGGGGGDGGSTQTQPPVATPDSATTIESQPVTINVLANDSDPAGLPLTVSVSVPSDLGVGTVNADGTITFTPTAEVLGSNYPFSYTVRNSAGRTANGEVRVSVALRRPLLYVADEDTANVHSLYLGDAVARRRISHALSAGESVIDFQAPAERPVVVYSTGSNQVATALNLRGLADNAPAAAPVHGPLPAGTTIRSYLLSPSGLRLAYVTHDQDGAPHLHVAALGSSVTVATVPIVTAQPDQIYNLAFGADESDLYFTLLRRVSGTWQSAVFRARGAAPADIERVTRLAVDPLSVGEFALRPQDAGLVYAGNTANGPQLLRVDFGVPDSDTILNQPFTSPAGPGEVRGIVQFAVSGNGNQVPHIVNAGRQDSFVSAMSQPGSARRINPITDVSLVGSFVTAPDTSRILLRVGVVGLGFQIGVVDLESGADMTYLTQGGVISGFALAPGGQHAAITTESIVQLVNLQSSPHQSRNLEAIAQRAFEPKFSAGGRVLAYTDAVDGSLAVRRLRIANYAELTPTRKWTGLEISAPNPSRGVQSFAFAPARPY